MRSYYLIDDPHFLIVVHLCPVARLGEVLITEDTRMKTSGHVGTQREKSTDQPLEVRGSTRGHGVDEAGRCAGAMQRGWLGVMGCRRR